MDYIQTGYLSDETRFSFTKSEGELTSLTLNQNDQAISLSKKELKLLLKFMEALEEIDT